MNIAQLSEQLKDVPQPKLIDYARNPNSVVPQFLALAEIQRRQRLQTPQGMAVSSTVADDVLQQANPVPQMQPQMAPQMPPQMAQGVPSLPSGMGQQSFAGGGIVAFAEGGELDDDEDELLDREERGMMSLLAGLKQRMMNPLARLEGMPASGTARRAMAESAGEPTEKRGSHKYEDLVLSKAKAVNNDPNFLSLARHVLYKETGNLENPEKAVSRAGARGIMQLMPATAKMLGVNPDVPEENVLGGVTYLNQLYKKYGGDPVLTAAAYNAGPGRVDRLLKSGQGLTALPRETRGYIAGLAEGGEVKRYQVGGDIADPEMVRRAYIDAALLQKPQSSQADVRRVDEMMGLPQPREYEEYYGDLENYFTGNLLEDRKKFNFIDPFKSLKSIKKPKKGEQADVRRVDNQIIEDQKKSTASKDAASPQTKNADQAAATNPAAQTSQVTETKPEEKDLFAEYIARQQAAREGLKKSAEEDKYMAILQAGLGMLGGTSPYALANIGAGAMQGVKGYGESKRARAAEALALDKAELGALRARELSDIKKAQMEQLADYRKGRLSQTDEQKMIKLNAMLNNDPQIKSLEKRRQAENPLPGSPEDLYYDQAIEAIRRARYEQMGVPYEFAPVQLPAYPTKPKEPSWWEGFFVKSKPAQSTVPPPPPGFKPQ